MDADFCGLHGVEHEDDPISAKSRTGFVISYGKCLLIWKSVLQTDTATSTLHAEYTALSHALREVIPLRQQIMEVLSVLIPATVIPTPVIRCTIFEDNQGALSLATTHRLSNRTKALNYKLHHFWEHVERKGEKSSDGDKIRIEKCNTTKQNADYFTKPLPTEPFLACCHRNQGA